MDSNKLELSAKQSGDVPASYKAIPEIDMEEEAVIRSKNNSKPKIGGAELDGADEKMLAEEDEKIEFKTLEADKEAVSEKQNGDAKLDIGELKSQFVGLTKEELMKYANDPFWVRLRWFLFISFWLLWAAMLVGAIMIIYAAPKCDPPAPKTWWEKGPLAEVKPTVTIEELKSLQVEKEIQGFILTWPGDVYAPLDDPNSVDLIALLKNASELNLNVIPQLEAGSSDVWFARSEAKEPGFEDFYIWKMGRYVDGSNPEPPNNWKVVNSSESSWNYSKIRNEFYYAPRGKPQLNLRNPNVSSEFSKVLIRLLDSGAKGVQLKGVPWLLADAHLQDESPNPNGNKLGFFLTDYGFYTHSKTENLLELGGLLHEWRLIVQNKTDHSGPFMSADPLDNVQAYKVNNTLVFDLPLQSRLFTEDYSDASRIIQGLDDIFNSTKIAWPLWKYAKRDGNDALEIVTFLLPGASLIDVTSNSTLNPDLLKQRNLPSVMRGSFNYHLIANKTVVAYIRVTASNPGVLVAYNPTDDTVVVDFVTDIREVSDEVTIMLYSNNYDQVDKKLIGKPGGKQSANQIPISKKSTIVVNYVPK